MEGRGYFYVRGGGIVVGGRGRSVFWRGVAGEETEVIASSVFYARECKMQMPDFQR